MPKKLSIRRQLEIEYKLKKNQLRAILCYADRSWSYFEVVGEEKFAKPYKTWRNSYTHYPFGNLRGLPSSEAAKDLKPASSLIEGESGYILIMNELPNRDPNKV